MIEDRDSRWREIHPLEKRMQRYVETLGRGYHPGDSSADIRAICGRFSFNCLDAVLRLVLEDYNFRSNRELEKMFDGFYEKAKIDSYESDR